MKLVYLFHTNIHPEILNQNYYTVLKPSMLNQCNVFQNVFSNINYTK